MKTILFFDRCDLTSLYILLTKELKGFFNIIHVAYSEWEIKMLKDSGIYDYIDYQNELAFAFDKCNPTDDLLKQIDDIIIKQSEGKFTLNGAIQSDRGYTILSYSEALKIACCHYIVWNNIFSPKHVDYMFHEPASQFMTHIAGVLCKDQGGEFIYQAQLLSDKSDYSYLAIDGVNFRCKDLERNYSYYCSNPDKVDIERCKKYLANFREDYSVAFGRLSKPKTSKLSLRWSAVKNYTVKLIRKNKYDRVKNNIDYWMLNNNIALEKIHNLSQYKKRGIKFENPIEGERYFYYSIHLEPEATVLYMGYGIYANQVKLIENIAASLPPGYYLYVKDHPHEFAYRKADDYERLLKVPNIRLIDWRIPGKLLMRDAIGVFSIVGTASFEALMLGKQSYCFGNSYYSISPRVNYVENIRDLRRVIYSNMLRNYSDDADLYTFIYAYLMSLKKGFVAYFGMDRVHKSGINEYENAKLLANEIISKLK